MSSHRPASATSVLRGARRPPFVAGLLRMAYQAARRRQLQVQFEHGFTDLTQSHLNVLVYPPPDGVRPSELAERCFMSKQAMNNLLGELEDRGYIERRSEQGRRAVLVHLTRRGWRFFETQWVAMKELEDEWAAFIGKKQFHEFLGTLRQLSALETTQGARQATPKKSDGGPDRGRAIGRPVARLR